MQLGHKQLKGNREIAELAYRGEVQLRILNPPEGDAMNTCIPTRLNTIRRTKLPLWLDWQIQQIGGSRSETSQPVSAKPANGKVTETN